MGILEKISEIEKEIARTQKNKGKFNHSCRYCFCNQQCGKLYKLSTRQKHIYLPCEYH